jgi:hypothetical protein
LKGTLQHKRVLAGKSTMPSPPPPPAVFAVTPLEGTGSRSNLFFFTVKKYRSLRKKSVLLLVAAPFTIHASMSAQAVCCFLFLSSNKGGQKKICLSSSESMPIYAGGRWIKLQACFQVETIVFLLKLSTTMLQAKYLLLRSFYTYRRLIHF